MAKLNPILQARMESLDAEVIGEISDEQVQAFEEGQELAASERAMDEANNDLNVVESAVDKMEDLQEAQEKNIQMMEGSEGGDVSTGESESQPVDGEVEAGNAGSVEVNEAVMSEPLPADEDQAVEVIDEQIHNEEIVMESIAASLGIEAKFGVSATKQLYSGLGIRTSKKTRGVGMESRNAPVGSRKSAAIQAYKAHCEGIGDAVKKMGSAVWDGIMKMINAIMEFIHKVVNNVSNFIKKFQEVEVTVQEIISNPDKFKLNDVFSKGYTEVSPASVMAGCITMNTVADNVLGSIEPSNKMFDTLIEFYDNFKPENIDENVNSFKEKFAKINNSTKMGALKFDGVTFEDNNTTGFLMGTGICLKEDVDPESFGKDGKFEAKVNEAKSVNIKFSSVKDLALRMKSIVDAFDTETIKKISKEGDICINKGKKMHVSMVNMIKKLGGDQDSIKEIRKNTSVALRQTKSIFAVIQVAKNALDLLGSGIEK